MIIVCSPKKILRVIRNQNISSQIPNYFLARRLMNRGLLSQYFTRPFCASSSISNGGSPSVTSTLADFLSRELQYLASKSLTVSSWSSVSLTYYRREKDQFTKCSSDQVGASLHINHDHEVHGNCRHTKLMTLVSDKILSNLLKSKLMLRFVGLFDNLVEQLQVSDIFPKTKLTQFPFGSFVRNTLSAISRMDLAQLVKTKEILSKLSRNPECISDPKLLKELMSVLPRKVQIELVTTHGITFLCPRFLKAKIIAIDSKLLMELNRFKMVSKSSNEIQTGLRDNLIRSISSMDSDLYSFISLTGFLNVICIWTLNLCISYTQVKAACENLIQSGSSDFKPSKVFSENETSGHKDSTLGFYHPHFEKIHIMGDSVDITTDIIISTLTNTLTSLLENFKLVFSHDQKRTMKRYGKPLGQSADKVVTKPRIKAKKHPIGSRSIGTIAPIKNSVTGDNSILIGISGNRTMRTYGVQNVTPTPFSLDKPKDFLPKWLIAKIEKSRGDFDKCVESKAKFTDPVPHLQRYKGRHVMKIDHVEWISYELEYLCDLKNDHANKRVDTGIPVGYKILIIDPLSPGHATRPDMIRFSDFDSQRNHYSQRTSNRFSKFKYHVGIAFPIEQVPIIPIHHREFRVNKSRLPLISKCGNHSLLGISLSNGDQFHIIILNQTLFDFRQIRRYAYTSGKKSYNFSTYFGEIHPVEIQVDKTGIAADYRSSVHTSRQYSIERATNRFNKSRLSMEVFPNTKRCYDHLQSIGAVTLGKTHGPFRPISKRKIHHHVLIPNGLILGGYSYRSKDLQLYVELMKWEIGRIVTKINAFLRKSTSHKKVFNPYLLVDMINNIFPSTCSMELRRPTSLTVRGGSFNPDKLIARISRIMDFWLMQNLVVFVDRIIIMHVPSGGISSRIFLKQHKNSLLWLRRTLLRILLPDLGIPKEAKALDYSENMADKPMRFATGQIGMNSKIIDNSLKKHSEIRSSFRDKLELWEEFNLQYNTLRNILQGLSSLDNAVLRFEQTKGVGNLLLPGYNQTQISIADLLNDQIKKQLAITKSHRGSFVSYDKSRKQHIAALYPEFEV